MWSGPYPHFPVWVTRTTYRVGAETAPDTGLRGTMQEQRVAEPSLLQQQATSLLRHKEKSRSLAEYSAKLLLETARMFPLQHQHTGPTQIFKPVPPGQEPGDLGSADKGHGITESGGSQSESDRRRKQKHPRRHTVDNETYSTRLDRTEPGTRQVADKSVQCVILSPMGPPKEQTGRKGGVTVRKLPVGDQRKAHERRKSVIERNIWTGEPSHSL